MKFSSGGSDGESMIPQGLAVDADNNILVADQSVMGVTRFTFSGEQIGNNVTTSDTPWGISFDEMKNCLAVATSHGLEVYQF